MHENEEVVTRVEGLLAAEEGAPVPEKKEEQPAPAQVQQSEPQPQPQPEPQKPEEKPAAEPEEKPAEEKPAADEVIATSIGDLAEYLNEQGVSVNAADLYNLKLPVTNPKGEREEITIGQWKDGYQSSMKAQADAEKSIGETRNAMQQLQSDQQRMHAQLNELAYLANADEAQLAGEAKAVDWNELRQMDPAEYAATRQEFEDRHRAIQGRKQQISQHMAQHQQANAQQQQKHMAETLQKEHAILPQAIPEWRDKAVAETERGELLQYLSTFGYSPQELNGIADHRAVVMMRKAMLFDRQQKANPEAKKVLKIGAKVLKPGVSRSKKQLENDSYQDDLKRFRNSGGRDENMAVDLIEKHLLGELQ